jgi:hypothetical protein
VHTMRSGWNRRSRRIVVDTLPPRAVGADVLDRRPGARTGTPQVAM